MRRKVCTPCLRQFALAQPARPGGMHDLRSAHSRLLSRGSLIRAWELWSNRRWLAVFVVLVTVVYGLAIGVAAVSTVPRLNNVLLFGALLVCSAATVEMTRRAGENAGLVKDVYGVWELPVAILLPPLYALIAPIMRTALTQWRVRPAPDGTGGCSTRRSSGCPTAVRHSSFTRSSTWTSGRPLSPARTRRA